MRASSPGFASSRLERESVQVHDRGDDAQSEPRARQTRRVGAAMKTAQHRVALVGRNAGAVVADIDDRRRRLLRSPQSTRRATRELDRIVDEIADRLEQQLVVGLDDRQRTFLEAHRYAALLGKRLVEIEDILDEMRTGRRREARPARARLDLGDAQQRGEAVEDDVEIRHRLFGQSGNFAGTSGRSCAR